ncbi:DinB family protein [Gottfriedia luciferensis]|uniref:DinB family protein n=1 Tax=Gottfriedia luciferensis TaxID=178774 RepID=UPI000B448BEC|nr:DinB family protein [Gottfriedia luciferensis]
MFINVEEFITEWKFEEANTIKLLNAMTDESLDQSIGEDFSSLGELAWHLTTAIKAIVSQSGLQFEAPMSKEDMPATAKELAEKYAQASKSMIEAAQAEWKEKDLKQIINAFGFLDMPIFALLRMAIQHQTHHRGQMTVLMRQAGLAVPGMYGPSKEEWAAMKR